MRALVMAAAQPAPELISLPGLGHIEDETLAERYQVPAPAAPEGAAQFRVLLNLGAGRHTRPFGCDALRVGVG